RPPAPSVFPYTALFRSCSNRSPCECCKKALTPAVTVGPLYSTVGDNAGLYVMESGRFIRVTDPVNAVAYGNETYVAVSHRIYRIDRKSTRLNSSHVKTS